MKALFPNWMLSFTEHGRKVKLAFDEIEVGDVHPAEYVIYCSNTSWVPEIHVRNGR